MKFKFIRIPAKPSPAFPNKYSTLVPIIPVRLINKAKQDKYIDIRAMIDSGADVSIFPMSIADKIELNIDRRKIQQIRGIEQSIIETYRHEIYLEIGGWKFDTDACFCSKDITFPVLGRHGFFNLFEVRFDYEKESIELKPKI